MAYQASRVAGYITTSTISFRSTSEPKKDVGKNQVWKDRGIRRRRSDEWLTVVPHQIQVTSTMAIAVPPAKSDLNGTPV